MADLLRLMCITAHPDDECMGMGGILAHYAAEGVETAVLAATRGERGWQGKEEENPGLTALGQMREKELQAAIDVLGAHELHFLDYIDGDLDQADPHEAVARIVPHLRRFRPHVVATFGLDGAYGHPDHIAICQFTTAALVCAADQAYPAGGDLPPHRVSKLYHMATTQQQADLFAMLFGEIVMPVDGVERRGVVVPDWEISARVDCREHWQSVWNAVLCHTSQLPEYSKLESMNEEQHKTLWGDQTYVRAYSTVNAGRTVEADLFEGLR